MSDTCSRTFPERRESERRTVEAPVDIELSELDRRESERRKPEQQPEPKAPEVAK